MSTGDVFQELYAAPQQNSLPTGVRLGPVLFSHALLPVDPASQRVVPGDMEAQLRAVFQNMDRFLAAAGSDQQDVAHITLFMAQTSDRTAMNVIYKQWYPDPNNRPPHKYVPVALPEGVLAAAQVIAVPGSGRRVIEVPGIGHQDWMSMSSLQGNLVSSSRIFGTDPATGKGSPDPEEHTAIVFRNADAVLQMAGGGWGNVTQVTAFIGGPELRPTVERQLRERVPAGSGQPALNVLETNLGGQTGPGGGPMLPRLEVLAVI